MLLVKTKIGPSNIHGIDIFADEFIPKGTRIWEYREGIDSSFDEEFLKSLSEPAQKQMLNYSYQDLQTGRYILCGDDARFFNHSDTPNTEDVSFENGFEGITVAARDIGSGEEIVSDYKSFDATFREWGIL